MNSTQGYVEGSAGYPGSENSAAGRKGQYEACCNIDTDCVDHDGDCVTTCEFSQLDNGQGPPGSRDYYCTLSEWWPKVYGKVTDVKGNAVEGAVVTVFGAEHHDVKHGETITGPSPYGFPSGEYVTYVPNATYDLIASKPQDGYEDTVFFNVPIHEPTQVDFVLRRPSTECNDDCTKSDGLCHADCDGKELCRFPSPSLATACDGSAPGVIALSGGNFLNAATVGALRALFHEYLPTSSFAVRRPFVQ